MPPEHEGSTLKEFEIDVLKGQSSLEHNNHLLYTFSCWPLTDKLRVKRLMATR